MFSATPPPNRKTDHRLLNTRLVIATNRQLPNSAHASSCDRTVRF